VKARILVLGAAAAALGCNAKSTGVHPGISSSCSVTLSGAISGGPYDCQPATTAWSLADNYGGFSFAVAASGTRPAVSVAIEWIGEPVVGGYTNGDAGALANLTVTASNNQSWVASVTGTAAPSGSYGLLFSSIVDNLNVAGGKGYSAEGTLTASLPAVTATGATGTVTINATF
jgi:hypothetical protein